MKQNNILLIMKKLVIDFKESINSLNYFVHGHSLPFEDLIKTQNYKKFKENINETIENIENLKNKSNDDAFKNIILESNEGIGEINSFFLIIQKLLIDIENHKFKNIKGELNIILDNFFYIKRKIKEITNNLFDFFLKNIKNINKQKKIKSFKNEINNVLNEESLKLSFEKNTIDNLILSNSKNSKFWNERGEILKQLFNNTNSEFYKMLNNLYLFQKQFILQEGVLNIVSIINSSEVNSLAQLKQKILNNNEITKNFKDLKISLKRVVESFDSPDGGRKSMVINYFMKNAKISEDNLAYFFQDNIKKEINKIISGNLKQYTMNSDFLKYNFIDELKSELISLNDLIKDFDLFDLLKNKKYMEKLFNLNFFSKKRMNNLIIVFFIAINHEFMLINYLKEVDNDTVLDITAFKTLSEKFIKFIFSGSIPINSRKLFDLILLSENLETPDRINSKIKDFIENFEENNEKKLEFEKIIGGGEDNKFKETHKKYDLIKIIEKTEIYKIFRAKEITDDGKKLFEELKKIEKIINELDNYNEFLFRGINMDNFIFKESDSFSKSNNMVEVILNKFKFSYWSNIYLKKYLEFKIFDQNKEALLKLENYEKQLIILNKQEKNINKLKTYNDFMEKYGDKIGYFHSNFLTNNSIFNKEYKVYKTDEIKKLVEEYVKFLLNVNDYYLNMKKIMEILNELYVLIIKKKIV